MSWGRVSRVVEGATLPGWIEYVKPEDSRCACGATVREGLTRQAHSAVLELAEINGANVWRSHRENCPIQRGGEVLA